jgi:hypothetical protein
MADYPKTIVLNPVPITQSHQKNSTSIFLLA